MYVYLNDLIYKYYLYNLLSIIILLSTQIYSSIDSVEILSNSKINNNLKDSNDNLYCMNSELKFIFINLINNQCLKEFIDHTKYNQGNLLAKKKLNNKKQNIKQVNDNGCSCDKIISFEQTNIELNNYLKEKNNIKNDLQDDKFKLNKFNGFNKLDNMILLMENEFLKGTNKDCAIKSDNEIPYYEYVNKFYLDKTEVSNLDFSLFILLTNYRTDAELLNSSFVFDGLINDQIKSKIKNNDNSIDDDKLDYKITQLPWWFELKNINWFKINKQNQSIFKISIEELIYKFSNEFLIQFNNDYKFDLNQYFEWIKQYTNDIHLLEHPVIYVSWNDSMNYCKFFNKRLPSELEFEYACKSEHNGQDLKFPWGDTFDSKYLANIWHGKFPIENTMDDGYFATAPVNSLEEQTKSGFRHLIGNVWEWTADDWSMRKRNNNSKPANSIRRKVKKGGSFLCHESYCNRYRCSARAFATSDTSASNLGFRCAKDA